MRKKRIAALLLAALAALSLGGCGAKNDMDDKKNTATGRSVQPLELTEEESALTELLGLEMGGYRIFDFQLGEDSGVKSLCLFAYELENGAWHDLSTQIQPFSDPSGRVALTFGKMPDGVKMTVQGASGTSSSSFAPPVEGDPAAMTYATSVLNAQSDIPWDEEIPLALQIATSQSEFSTYNVDYFSMPRELAKHDYDHVYAITVMFSQKSVDQIVHNTAPGIPEPEPSASPSGEPTPEPPQT